MTRQERGTDPNAKPAIETLLVKLDYLLSQKVKRIDYHELGDADEVEKFIRKMIIDQKIPYKDYTLNQGYMVVHKTSNFKQGIKKTLEMVRKLVGIRNYQTNLKDVIGLVSGRNPSTASSIDTNRTYSSSSTTKAKFIKSDGERILIERGGRQEWLTPGHVVLSPGSVINWDDLMLIDKENNRMLANHENRVVWLPMSNADFEAIKKGIEASLTPEAKAYVERMQREQASNQGRPAMEPAQLARLKKLVRVSKTLKVSQMAKILEMSEDELYRRIVDWADEFGFTLDGETVEFGAGRKDDFLASLDNAFDTWSTKDKTKGGKI